MDKTSIYPKPKSRFIVDIKKARL